MGMAVRQKEGRPAHLVSLTIYIEMRGHVIYQNDLLDEADN